jgi:predicted MFS family arabinose efflux permease
MITMGARQSLGLFLSPLNTATGLGVAAISLAMAVGQLTWGAVQPIAGLVADRYGAGRVIAAGGILLAIGLALTPMMGSGAGLWLSLGFLMAAGAGAGSFGVLLSAAAKTVPVEKRAMAGGMINAGGSFGQFVFAPLVQKLIAAFGWVSAIWTVAAISLLTLPLAWRLRGQRILSNPSQVGKDDGGFKAAMAIAFRSQSYWLLHAGFFTCGFHIAFLVTHLPGEVALCGLSASVASWAVGIIGLANIVGSLAVGWWMGRERSKTILVWMYASRAVLISVYLLAPKTEATFYIFAAGLGLTWLATVPPTAGVVGKLFGTRYLATLFGLTMLSHQIGAFFGAWLGGIAVSETGSYEVMWIADIILAAIAALVNLPIREAHPRASVAATG